MYPGAQGNSASAGNASLDDCLLHYIAQQTTGGAGWMRRREPPSFIARSVAQRPQMEREKAEAEPNEDQEGTLQGSPTGGDSYGDRTPIVRPGQGAFGEPDTLKVARPVCAVRRVVVSLLQAGGTEERFLGYWHIWRRKLKETKHAREAMHV